MVSISEKSKVNVTYDAETLALQWTRKRELFPTYRHGNAGADKDQPASVGSQWVRVVITPSVMLTRCGIVGSSRPAQRLSSLDLVGKLNAGIPEGAGTFIN